MARHLMAHIQVGENWFTKPGQRYKYSIMLIILGEHNMCGSFQIGLNQNTSSATLTKLLDSSNGAMKRGAAIIAHPSYAE